MYGHITRTTLVASVLAFTGIAYAGITGSLHDFSAETWNAEGEICNACHTPHNALDTIVPLWNHDTTASTFTVYTSDTMDATAPLGTAIGDESLVCLSCHDGSVALDSYGGATGTVFMTGTALVSTDLTNDHPISITYDAALATLDGELFDPATTSSGLSGVIADDMLFAGQMECASCHDVHDDSFGSFLILDNAASALCLTCHDK